MFARLEKTQKDEVFSSYFGLLKHGNAQKLVRAILEIEKRAEKG